MTELGYPKQESKPTGRIVIPESPSRLTRWVKTRNKPIWKLPKLKKYCPYCGSSNITIKRRQVYGTTPFVEEAECRDCDSKF